MVRNSEHREKGRSLIRAYEGLIRELWLIIRFSTTSYAHKAFDFFLMKDLILHDQIWYNAIRAVVSVESRSDSRIADAVLDRLIREGLIDRDKEEVLLAMQQWLRYPAILADRLANSQGVLSKEVIGYSNLFVLLLTNWYIRKKSKALWAL